MVSLATLEEIKEKFNSLIDENKSSMSKITVLRGKRARSVNARIKEFGKDKFIAGLENATKSKFFNEI